MEGDYMLKQGLVTKIENKFMIVKTDETDIERIKIRQNVKVGDSISYEKKDIYKLLQLSIMTVLI